MNMSENDFGEDEAVRRQLNNTAKVSFGLNNGDEKDQDSLWKASSAIIEVRERVIQRYGEVVGGEALRISNALTRLISVFVLKARPKSLIVFFIALRATCDRLLFGMTASNDDLQEECSRALGWLHTDDVERLQLPELMEQVEKIDKLID